jgi:hypothetical protein
MTEPRHWVKVNRAPVLTLWAAVVAERLGFNRGEALTLGRAVAGLNAYSKGKSLGIFKPSKTEIQKKRKALPESEILYVDLLGRSVPTILVDGSLRALSKNKPIEPDSVTRYLQGKLADAFDETKSAMDALAKSRKPQDLADHAYGMYTAFRPEIPSGKKGWGAEGRLSLDRLRELTKEL